MLKDVVEKIEISIEITKKLGYSFICGNWGDVNKKTCCLIGSILIASKKNALLNKEINDCIKIDEVSKILGIEFKNVVSIINGYENLAILDKDKRFYFIGRDFRKKLII